MPSLEAHPNFLVMPEPDDLASVRHELDRLLWSRDGWSADDATLYEDLTARELQLLSSDFTSK